MATFRDSDHDELKTCPYNPAHKVAARRFQIHISKCAQTAVGQFQVCPYNSAHRVPAAEFDHHRLTCGDSRQTIREVMDRTAQRREQANGTGAGSASAARAKFLDRSGAEPIHGTADWGDGDEVYVMPGMNRDSALAALEGDGEEYVAPQTISRMTPSERVSFYEKRNELAKKKQAEARRRQAQELEEEQAASGQPSAAAGAADSDRAPRTRPVHFGGVGRGTRPPPAVLPPAQPVKREATSGLAGGGHFPAPGAGRGRARYAGSPAPTPVGGSQKRPRSQSDPYDEEDFPL